MSRTIQQIFWSLFTLFVITAKEQILRPCYIAGKQITRTANTTSYFLLLESVYLNRFTSYHFHATIRNLQLFFASPNIVHAQQVGVTFKVCRDSYIAWLSCLDFNFFFVHSFIFSSFWSAGVGRTGVLIFMESAFNMIEGAEPIFPLEIVRKMRDQRCSLIQTPVSWITITICFRC